MGRQPSGSTAATNDRTATLKRIDHWLGLPLCVCAGIGATVSRLLRGVHPVPANARPRTIVISKFFGLGSIVLSSALARALRGRYPNAQLVYLTFEGNVAVLSRLSICDRIMRVTLRSPWAFVGSVLRFLSFCIRSRPDIFIDLEFYSKFSTLLAFCSRARWRAGFFLPQFWRTSLINLPIHFNMSRHILDIYAMVGETVGAPVTDPLPSPIAVSDDDRRALEQELASFPEPLRGVVVGVNVNASDLALCRRWPRERFVSVIEGLLRWREDLSVVLTGSLDEAAYTAGVMTLLGDSRGGRVVDASGKLSFGEYLALLGRLDVLLTNDSGPFHLAKASGLPTVSVWGPGSPSLYGPYGREKDSHVTIHKQWRCSPCLYIYRTDAGLFCGGATPCMDAIGGDEVLHTLQAFIAARGFSGVRP